MSIWIKPQQLIISGLLLCLYLLIATPAQSHGYIVRSSPEARSVLARPPKQVQIWFSEGLAPDISTIAVFNQAGQQIDLGDGGLAPNNPAKLQVSLPSDLPNGAYLVRMRPVFTNDGHAVNDTLVFWIGQQIGNIEAEESSEQANPLEAIWRAVLSLSLSLLFGAYWMYAWVLRPAWGNPKWPLGHLPPRIMIRLSRLVWGSLLLAWISNLLALLQITMALFEASMQDVFQNELWNITLAGTRFGDAWGYRMGLLTAILFIQIVAAQQAKNRPQSTHALWLLNAGLSFLTLGTLALISHAGGAPFWRIAAILVDYAHLAGVAAWVGGLLVFALILHPALAPLHPEARFVALKAALGRFSVVAAFLILLIITTGIFSSMMAIPSAKDLTSSTYGITLLAKGMLILPVFILGALHYLSLNHLRFSQFIQHWPQTLRMEAIFVLAVLFAAGWLPATPPPQPETIPQKDHSQALQQGDYTIRLEIAPSAKGSNTYDVLIEGETLTIESVKLRFADPAYGRYTPPLELDEIRTGEWGGASGDVSRAADWLVLVDVYPANQMPLRAAFEWPFAAEAASARPPKLGNWLSAFALAVVMLWGASQVQAPWQANYRLASGLILAGTLIMVASALWFRAENSRRLEERRNPRPEILNPAFPDQNSLQAGAQIYAADCASCHASSTDLNPLRRTDADLWRILSRGMVNRHFFGTELSEQERWDLINFLRQREGESG